MNSKWKVVGTYFEACSCEAACPCFFTSPPTDGKCTALLAWNIEKGNFGEIALDGFNAMLAAYAPGPMLEGKWKVALYVDQRADAQQQDAIGKIFSGQAGGHLATLSPLISEVLGIKSAPIEYTAQGRERRLRIPDVAAAEIEALAGQDGAEVTISNHPFTAVPGYPAVVAKSKSTSYKDYGLTLEVSGKSGFYSPFSYQVN